MADFRSRYGWYAVLGLLFNSMLFIGTVKGLGFMLPIFMEQFEAQTWLIGWMIAMTVGMMHMGGIFAPPLESLFGTRAVVMVSGVMVGGSLIAASVATSLAEITLILALGVGVGISFGNILLRAVIARSFENNYATVNGIGQAGSPLRLIAIAPLVQLLLGTYGWRGTLLLLGGISLNIVVGGALLRSPSTQNKNRDLYQAVSTGREGNSQETTKSRQIVLKGLLVTVKRQFGIAVCSRLSFWITTIVFISNMLAETFWYIYYLDHVEMKGFTADDVVAFSTAAGVGKLVSKIAFGLLVDKDVLKLRPAMALLSTVCMAALITDKWMHSFWMVLVNAFFVGFSGALNSLNDVYTRELIGTELLASAFSWMELVNGIFVLLAGFIPGLMHDMIGNYDVAFILMGCLYVLPLVALAIEYVRPKQNT